MPDSLVRVQLQATGADQILATLRAVRQEVALLGQQSARINLAANTTTVNQQLGQITTELARINQMTARARVDVDTSQAENRLAGLESKVSSIMTGSLAAIGAIIGVQITKGIGAAADAIVGFNSTLEQTRVAFTSLFGSASRANDFLGQLQDFAKKTPFDFDQVNRYAQRLLAVGFAAKDVIPDLTAMGNAVAAAGGNAETLDRVTLALGQMHGSIKLNSQDMLQLIQANIPAWKLLADQMGVTEAKARQLAETGKISGADASTAIIAGMSQLPNLMDQISKTFAGRLENLKDTFRQEMAGIGQPLFAELSKAVDLASAALASPKFAQAAKDMVDDLTAITKAAEAVATALGKIPTSAIPYLEAALSPGHALIGAARALGKGPAIPGIDTGPAADQSAAGDFAPTLSGAGFLQQRAATGVLTDLTNQVRTGALTADQARQQWRALSDTFGGLFSNAQALDKLFGDQLHQAMADHIAQVNDATAAHEKLQDALKQAGQAQALGASSEDVGRAIFGITGTGAQATPEQIQRAKQDIQDLTTAYQRAAQVIGTVDLAHGIAGFAAVAPDLAKARDSLRDLGQSNQALDNLASLSAEFKGLTDATDAATTAYRGFMLTLTETDQKIQQLTTFRGQVTGAVSDADRRRSLGIATPEDLQLLSTYKNILANIDQQKTGLQRNATGDILGIAANYPDLKKADDTLRDMIGKVGGPQQLVIDVKTNTDKALEQITDLLAKPHQATIDVQIATHLTGLPPALATIIANAAGAQIGGAQPAGGTVGDSGYARPTTIRSTGGGPYGNDTLQQGGAGGGNLSFDRWNSIIQQGSIAGGAPSPLLNNLDQFKAFMDGVNKSGLDPYIALAAMQQESHFGTDPNGTRTANPNVNNYIGMGVNTRPFGLPAGSGAAATDAGPSNYAAYASLSGQVQDLAAWIKETNPGATTIPGMFAGYSTSGAAASQKQDIYNQISGGAGAQQHDQVASTVRDQIVQKALADVDQDKLAGYCEQWVEETVQAITGKRGATGKNEASANAAFASAQRQGLVTTDPQPGDLVYYGDATNGHVAIYMGGGKQVSTADVGGSRIHTEAVGKGAQYVSIGAAGGASGLSPELAAALGIHSGAQSYLAAAGGGTTNLTGAASGGDIASIISGAATTAGRAGAGTIQGAGIGQTLASLNPQDAQNALAAYQQILPMLREAANLKYPELPVTAENEALQQGLGFLQAWGQAQGDIRTGAAGFADDMQRVTDIIGGPLGAAYAKILQAQYQSARINEQIVSTQSAITQLDTAHQATVAQRAADDRQAGRDQTRQGWADQASDRARQQQQQRQQQANQDAQNAENRGYTGVTRSFQDRQRALQFSQQVQGTDLQNQLSDLQKAQTQGGYNRTAQEQLVAGQAAGAGTNQAAGVFSAQLAAMHDRDTMQKDADAAAIDALQEKIRLQQKQANLDTYNLETESIQAQRAHEDRMAQLSDQATAQQQNAQAENDAIQEQRTERDQAHQEQQWQLEDTRASEDAAYQQQKASLTDHLTGLQAQKQAQDDLMTSLQQMIGLMGQFGDAGTAALSQMVASAGNAGGGSSYLNAQPVGGGSIRRLAGGGTVPIGGQAFVGESGIEHLLMTPRGAVVTPMGGGRAGGGGTTITLGDVTVHAGASEDEIMAAVLPAMAAKIRAALRAQTAAKRAQGVV